MLKPFISRLALTLIVMVTESSTSKMVVIEGVGHWWRFFEQPPAPDRLRGWIDATREQAGRTPRRYRSLEEAFQRMQDTNPHLSPEQARHLTEHGSYQNEDGTYTWKFDNYTHAHSPYDITSEDTEALWREITCPILFVNAKQGYPHRIGQGDTLAHFRNASVVDLDQAGHWAHHDQLDAFVGEAERFLAH